MKDKDRALKKIDVVICKLQDLYYMNIDSRVASKLNDTLDKARELQSRIEDQSDWKPKN